MVLIRNITKEEIVIGNSLPEHARGICEVIRLAFGVPSGDCDGCFYPENILEHLKRFPEGHFVALHDGKVVGAAITMRTGKQPEFAAHEWLEAIGGFNMTNHDPNGQWLYGVEMAVHPDYQGNGVGTKLYQARFNLVKQLNLKGWYAVGMLMGYYRYRHQMSVREYGEKVMRRELNDPTVTMQMNRGFEPWDVFENYEDEEQAGFAGVQIVWHNPAYSG